MWVSVCNKGSNALGRAALSRPGGAPTRSPHLPSSPRERLQDAERAAAAYARAQALRPDDSRLLYERDQLARRCRAPPAERLAALEARMDLVRSRDALAAEACSLYCQAGRPQAALDLLRSRRWQVGGRWFGYQGRAPCWGWKAGQAPRALLKLHASGCIPSRPQPCNPPQPWEGGEGQALGQHVRAHLALGRAALAGGRPDEAAALFGAALESPHNLGEAKHLLANDADARYWLGEALAAAGRQVGAGRRVRRVEGRGGGRYALSCPPIR